MEHYNYVQQTLGKHSLAYLDYKKMLIENLYENLEQCKDDIAIKNIQMESIVDQLTDLGEEVE